MYMASAPRYQKFTSLPAAHLPMWRAFLGSRELRGVERDGLPLGAVVSEQVTEPFFTKALVPLGLESSIFSL